MRTLVSLLLAAALAVAACGSKSAPANADATPPAPAAPPAADVTAPAPPEPTAPEPGPETDAEVAAPEPDAEPAAPEPDAAPAGVPTPVVIYDGRPGAAETPTLAHDAALDALLFKAVGGDYVTDREQCDDSEDRVVLRVAGGARGAFLAPGEDQALFLVTAEPCNPMSVADARRPSRAIIVEDGAVVAALEVFGDALTAALDVDADGVTEIVTAGGGTGQGYTVENLRVTRVAGGRPEVVHSQDDVYTDNCGTVEEVLEMEASVMTVTPGTPATYARQRFGAPCEGGEEGAAGFRLLTE